LRRTAASGGGSRSVTKIAFDLFGKCFRNLSSAQKREVETQQAQEFRWRNNHRNLCVFSTKCSQISPSTNPDDRILPCAECLSLLQLQEFKTSLRVPMPLDKNYRHVNKQWRNPILGEQFLKTAGLKELFDSVVTNSSSSIFVNFAKGAVSGKYKDNEVFLGLLKAMMQKIDRDERGVGMQNFRYAPEWDEFVHI
ncbi:hypothetical protein FB446DRAFT_611669, partial [Lentinula raphanica]